MQKAISKYGLAAHLALLAVAPLFLFPFCGEAWTGHALLWLSLVSAVWTVTEPSRRSDEMPHEARFRVWAAIANDPLLWFCAFLVVMAACRWLNGGVRMVFDAENVVWSLAEPVMPFIPGSAGSSGYVPFATTVALSVLMLAGRHALGKAARVCFLFAAAFLAGLAAVSAGIATVYGHSRVMELVACPTTDASYLGTAYGLHLMGAMVALAGLFERRWNKAVPLLVLSIGGCVVGLFLFAPLVTVGLYLVGMLLMLALALAYAQVRIGGLVIPKCLVLFVVSFVLPVIFVWGVIPQSVTALRLAPLTGEAGVRLLPDGFFAMREVLSGFAEKVWHENPWLGTGLGSFALNIRFLATDADWAVISSRQVTALNGWWQFLSERGLMGALFFFAPLVLLLWVYAVRFARAVRGLAQTHAKGWIFSFHPICALGLAAVCLPVLGGFVDCSFWRPETVMAAGAVLAMAGNAFPRLKQSGGESETEK